MMVSVVIPTYNEATVIQETLRRASAALRAAGEDFELVVVDDSSPDGTAERATALTGDSPVRVLKRARRLGLATAVVDGWATASGAILGVMDADLQHPPEVLKELVQALRAEEADLVIASRYVPGGGTSDWTWTRRLVSKVATHLAATVLPLRMAAVLDPMSGMFLVRSSALDGTHLRPVGYKILLEVLAKGQFHKLVEVPYVFVERGPGSSKLVAQQYLEYLLHLARLAVETGQLRGWLQYALVGLTGALLDVAIFYALVQEARWSPFLALLLAIEVALLSNFTWNGTFTFRRDPAFPRGSGLLNRLLCYEWICFPGALLHALTTLFLLQRHAGLLEAAAAGVAVGGIFNFAFKIPAIWRTLGKQSPLSQSGFR